MPPPSKKRKITVTAPEKIDFDPSAREEYLTGFHKRKVARQKHAQEEIAKREKEEKLQFRRELRQQRRVDLEKHVEEVNRLVKQANGELDLHNGDSSDSDDDEEGEDTFKGFEDPEPINQEDEYIDEDKYTTVTIESVGISRSGFSRPGEDDGDEDGKEYKKGDENGEGENKVEEKEAGGIKRDANGKRIWTKERPKFDGVKKKKKKFRYEAPAERKANRAKISAKKKKQKSARESN